MGWVGLGWVRLRGFFYLTHYGESKKIQPNLTYMGRVGPMDWTNFFIIIIKLSRKKI